MNNTTDGTIAGCSSLINPKAYQIGATIACCLLLVVSLVGNSLIAIIVYKTRAMRTPINYFIVNMAMSDLLYPLVFFPLLLTKLYMKFWLISGPTGEAFCKLVFFLAGNSLIVAIQSLLLIAVDRFGAVAFPLRSPLFSSKQCLTLILATWVVAMVVNIPALLVLKLNGNPGQLQCTFQYTEAFGESFSEANYTLATTVVFIYIPLALLAILYIIIIIKLKMQEHPGKQSVNTERQRARRNRNALRMAIAIVLGFMLCWVPLTVIILLSQFAGKSGVRYCGILLIYAIVNSFVFLLSAAVHPCICFAFCENYRQGLKRLLTCRTESSLKTS